MSKLKSAVKRLMKMILSNGDGQALKDFKILIDSRSEALDEIDRLEKEKGYLQKTVGNMVREGDMLLGKAEVIEQRTKERLQEAISELPVTMGLISKSLVMLIFEQAIESTEVS